MKIVFTIGDITIRGGAERVVVNLANELSNRGHSIRILSFYKESENIPYSLNETIEIIFIYEISEKELMQKYKKNFLKRFYFKNLHKFILNLKIFLNFKDVDVFIANCFMFFPFLKHKNTKYIKLIHLGFTRYNTRNNLFPLLIILSNKELNKWSKYHSNIKVIPNFPSFEGNKNTNYKNKVVLSAGRLTKQKGFSRLIDIWSEIKKDENNTWKLIILGDGEERENLESKIKQLNLDSIILEPFNVDIESKYLSASIYALSSFYEGFGMVLLEASNYGLSLISFDINTGPSDIIENGVNGYLIEDNDLENYASKLKELMENEDKRRVMGEKAKEISEIKFGKEKIMNEWMKVLEG